MGNKKTINTYSDELITLGDQGFSKVGHSIKEWNINKDGSGISYALNSQVRFNADTILYAQWIPFVYTIKWNSNGGSQISDWKREYGSTYSTLPVPEKTNNQFLGWFTADGVKLTEGNTITKDETYYAHWKQLETYLIGSGAFLFAKTLPPDSSSLTIHERYINDYPLTSRGEYDYTTNTPVEICGVANRYIKISWEQRVIRSHSLYSSSSWIGLKITKKDENTTDSKIIVIPSTKLTATRTGLVGSQNVAENTGQWEYNKTHILDLMNLDYSVIQGVSPVIKDDKFTLECVSGVASMSLIFQAQGEEGGENKFTNMKVLTYS